MHMSCMGQRMSHLLLLLVLRHRRGAHQGDRPLLVAADGAGGRGWGLRLGVPSVKRGPRA